MSTRSNIGVINRDQTVEMVYCHNDGYPSWNGKILLEHWSDTAKVRSLLKQGDMSILGHKLGKKHDFDNWRLAYKNNWCCFYRRDRGEEDVSSQKLRNTKEAIRMMEEYLYLWDVTKKRWFYSDHGSDLTPFTIDCCKED